jgi:hypothetical protein
MKPWAAKSAALMRDIEVHAIGQLPGNGILGSIKFSGENKHWN